MKIRAFKDHAWDGLSLWFVVAEDGIKRRVAEPMQLSIKEYERGDFMPATLQIDAQATQSLMDDLWASGIRPTEARYPNDHVNALRDHLADMRRLVFDVQRPAQVNVTK